jgi:hypothetical protein
MLGEARTWGLATFAVIALALTLAARAPEENADDSQVPSNP